MNTLLSPAELSAALSLRDLTDPASGPHAMQLLLSAAVAALADSWPSRVSWHRDRPLVSTEDNYDRLGYGSAAITRDGRYSRYASETVMLRSHTSAGIPPALRALEAPDDVLLVLPGVVYRRDVIDRLHVGTPHQVDLWRIATRPLGEDDLLSMVDTLVRAVLPGARWRAEPATHPYTTSGRQIDVETPDGWVELAECGLAAPHVLRSAGLAGSWHGLALGMGLDRALMLRKGVPDIRLLRSSDPRIASQMQDLAPWRPVSMMPPVRRDLSLVVSVADEELLGDKARAAVDGDLVESLTVQAVTPHEDLPTAVQARLGTKPGQLNALVRLVLRPVDRTLTDAEANRLRDQVYAALHEGPHPEWTTH
ncbi:hypothetical protein [Labedaea rhizosphaerae]|uniref:Phenylalanyl-tRNA synthetase alpha subunit n=1 Tax=Labedaea rhizosphaerae TaxID=598644 RepID=A0A4V3CZ47_LABRH|nr:hypothetical protein [Labedaea rhizosphaerae]TDP96648.1 phenylalanyl-tRNA synthetase alpha subunit [Labedaea rhizosphaerae]